MKKFFLLFSAVLFLGSCTDLGVSEEDAVKDALPKDFKWEEYAKINSDVKSSQVIFNIRDEIEKERVAAGETSASSVAKVRENCVDILKEDLDFAKQIYVDYAGCPEQGWNRNSKCPGKYANNSGYSTDTTCSIGACWYGGWDDLGTAAPDFDVSLCDDTDFIYDNLAKCEAAKLIVTLESFLPGSLDEYKDNGRTSINAIPLMCQFVPLKENAAEAKSHLEYLASNTNQLLVELHYAEFGGHDGRPYKYCKEGHSGELKDRDKHASAKQASGTVYYDYIAYLFCLDESDWKIYTTEEE
jgi:hypothetical protein